MQPTTKPASKLRIILTWTVSIAVIFLAIFAGYWRHQDDPTPVESHHTIAYSVFSLFIGAFFLLIGVGGYFIVLFTTCFTFNFTQPIWNVLKVKIYFANLVLPMFFALGLGFAVSAFIGPVLGYFGLSQKSGEMMPVMVTLGIVLVAKLWFLEWGPLEKRAITKRLEAQGITPEQLQGAVLIGLSNPASGLSKRFASIEEDIGALWVGPEQLVYYGDNERFAITRAQIILIERKADNRSTSVLGGIAHVILHVALVDGTERQIRLHTEGLWTMGLKRRMMDSLAESIVRWHEAGVVPPVAQPAQAV